MARKNWSKKDNNKTPDAEDVLAAEDLTQDSTEVAEDTEAITGTILETELAEKLLETEQERDELNDQLLRTVAEFENFKRRTKREKDQLYTDSVSDVLKEWLPVLDNLERALEVCEKAETDEAVALGEGISLIYRQAGETLKKLGVEVIEAEGQPFDPQFHNAVAQVESDVYEEGTVVDVLAKGYKRGEWVIRHSVVRVAL